MTRIRRYLTAVPALLSLMAAGPVFAQFDSMSDGSDGALNITANTLIDLSLAAPAAWMTPSPVAGQGVYDADEWAVVFKYTTINVASGATVTFTNHPSGAPVVWLASGNVTLTGAINLNGKNGHNGNQPRVFADSGPGGFAGAGAGSNSTNRRPSGGFGPGGALTGTREYGAGGGYGFAGGGSFGVSGGGTYGNTFVFPLIGGSGGSAGFYVPTPTYCGGGGGGGGAMLIASTTTIALNGSISANGGTGGSTNGGGGSGGAIRLIANSVSGIGTLRALGGGSSGGVGGKGRIRVEGSSITLTDGGDPNYVEETQILGPVFPPANKPTLRMTMVDAAAVPADPAAGIGTSDVIINNPDPVTIEIEATNVPPGVTVEVRLAPERGDVIVITSDPLVGDLTHSTTTAVVPAFPAGRVEVQLRANWTP